MARKPTGNPVGPPKKVINWKMFEQLCSLQCTQSEISSFLKIHPDTLRVHCSDNYGEDYSTIYKKFSESGKCSLRRYQYVQAKTKPNMAIWLGKQWLGQKDDPSEEFEKTNKLVQVLLDEIMQMKQQRIEDQKKVIHPIYDGYPDAQK